MPLTVSECSSLGLYWLGFELCAGIFRSGYMRDGLQGYGVGDHSLSVNSRKDGEGKAYLKFQQEEVSRTYRMSSIVPFWMPYFLGRIQSPHSRLW